MYHHLLTFIVFLNLLDLLFEEYPAFSFQYNECECEVGAKRRKGSLQGKSFSL